MSESSEQPDTVGAGVAELGVAPSAEELGERIGANALRFVRHFRAPIERVWKAITTPEGIAVWLGRPIVIEAAGGGSFEVAFTDEDRMDGRVLECEINRRLSIEWHETSNGTSSPYATRYDDTSLVTFELAPGESGGTLLVFTHRYILGGETMIGFGAGWHAHLQSLQALLSGAQGVDRESLYATLQPVYEARLAHQS